MHCRIVLCNIFLCSWLMIALTTLVFDSFVCVDQALTIKQIVWLLHVLVSIWSLLMIALSARGFHSLKKCPVVFSRSTFEFSWSLHCLYGCVTHFYIPLKVFCNERSSHRRSSSIMEACLLANVVVQKMFSSIKCYLQSKIALHRMSSLIESSKVLILYNLLHKFEFVF